jgi:phytoene dehydrogenase-like protein
MSPASKDTDVVVVGAGLTGLRAALEISRAGLSVLVVEREASVGGRIRSSRVDGFILDHGFQVLLSGYPELGTIPALTSLGCKAFTPGARIRLDGKNYDLIDPRYKPGSALRTLYSPIVSLRDLVGLARMLIGAPMNLAAPCGDSTSNYLTKRGFSQLFQGAFLEPFLRGVLLDAQLTSDARLARFYLKVFSRGKALLPEQGMQAFPELLATALGREHIMLNSPVAHLRSDRVVLASGEEIRARRVICATDALSAAALGGPDQTSPHHGTVAFYFGANRPPYNEPLLMLNGDGRGPINNLSVVSNVQPSYAPPGKALICASIVGSEANRPINELEDRVRLQMHEWFGSETTEWTTLKVFSVPGALPACPRLSDGFKEANGVIYAGDYLSYGSQNGALAAGRTAGAVVVFEALL